MNGRTLRTVTLLAGLCIAEPLAAQDYAPTVRVPDAPAAPPAPAPPAPPHGYTPAPPGGLIPVELASTEPGARVEIHHQGDDPELDPPLFSCAQPCRVWIAPGTYDVSVTETDETVAGGRRAIEIDRPLRLELDPDTKLHRSAGLGLGIAGPIVLVLGVAVALGNDGQGYGDDAGASMGLLMILGGLSITPIGWVMYGTSIRPEYTIDEPGSYSARHGRNREPLVGPGPLGLGATLRF